MGWNTAASVPATGGGRSLWDKTGFRDRGGTDIFWEERDFGFAVGIGTAASRGVVLMGASTALPFTAPPPFGFRAG